MSSSTISHLSCRWNEYLRIQQNERSKKVVALDRFLREFINAEQPSVEGDSPKGCHEFSDMKSVSNLLAGELLVDVHHVCSTSDDDDTSHLQQYLLLGRGATLLKVLNTIGVQGVSCNRELGDLLATLLPLCCKFPCSRDVEYAGGSLAPVDACFKHLRTRKVAKPITKFPTLTEVRSSSTTHNVDEHTRWPPQRPPVRKSHSSNSDDSSESDVDTTHPRLLSGFRLRHPSMLHAGASAEVLGVFPGLLHDQPDEDGISDPTYENSGFSVKLHPLELCLTMLELMQSLCQGDSVELAQTRVVSFIVLPHLSHLLFSLVTETLVENLGLTEGWTLLQQLLLIRSLTRATLAVMSHASMQPNGVSYLGSHGCVLQLIEAAKVVAKCLPQPRADQVTWSDSDQEMLLFVDDVMYGLLMLFHTMLQSIPLNPSILSSSLKLLNELCDHGLQLVQVVLVHWERLLSSVETHPVQHTLAKEHIIGIVSSVGHVMASLKKAKVDYIHMMKCLKRRHKSCDFSHYTHHHHDILGISSSAFADYLVTMSDSYGSMEMINSESSEMNGQAECMLAVLGEFILQVLVDAQTKLLQIRLLACIEEAGLCCCMAPGRIQRHLLTHLEKQTPGVRSYILCVLTKVLMDFCGGAAQIQKSAHTICAVCRDVPAARLDMAPASRDHTQPRHEASDSALSSSEASLHESGKVCHPKWHCLRQFLPLLRHKDEALSVQVTQHVLRLISQASSMFKQQLFHSVFLPLLRQLKKCYLDPGGEGTDQGNDPSETVVQYCLSALPLLLHSKVAQDLFHNVGGVRLLQALIKIRSLRKCVLKVLQVLIILEERSCWEVFPQETVILAESTEPPDTEGVDPRLLTEEADNDTMSVCDAFMEIVLTHTPEQEHVNTEGAAQEDAVLEKSSSLLDLPSDRHDLSIMCDVWNACATLFPSSQQFQQKFLQSSGHDRALGVLRSALNKVVNATEDHLAAILPGWDRASPFQCWLSLIESTLFVCLSYSGSKITFGTEELSREKLLLEVQGWLQQSRSLSGLARRAVCDTLLSCATSHRNMRDIVSNHTFAVMHLRIDDSDEREVSEVSDYWSTAKESETCHTEQGYEADSEFTPDEHTKLEGDREGHQILPLPPRPLPTHVMHHPELTRLVLELLVLTPEAEPADSREEHTDSGASSQPEPADIKTSLQTEPAFLPASSHKQSSKLDTSQTKPTDTVHDERSTVSKINGSPDSANDGVLAHLLLRLISYAKQSAHIASTLYNQGLVGVILEGVKRTVGSGPQQVVERQLLLDLFLLISQHAFSSRELSAFLGLFKNTALATGSLLSAATSLAEAFQLKPTYILVFPVVRTSPTTFELSTRSISSDILAASLRAVEGEEPQSEYVELLRSSNVQEALDLDTVGSLDSPPSPQLASNRSPLYCAPIQMNLHDSLRWPRSDRSFSLSLWLQMEGGAKGDVSFMRRSRRVSRAAVMDISAETSLVNPEVVLPARLRAAMSRSATSQLWTERCLHLASLGSERQRVELWADPDTGSLICRRLAQPEEGEELVAGQACLAGLLGFGCWEHLSVNYQEFSHEGTRRAKLSAYVNGCYSREATFDLQSRGHRKKKAAAGSTRDSDSVTLLMVGHSLSPKEAAVSPTSWHLGNLMLFKGTVLSQSVSFHLYTLGPDCCSVSQCDSADLPTDYPRHITRDLLHQTTLNLDLFTTNQNVSLQPLRENMVAMYAPAQLATFNLYRPTSTQRSNIAPTPSTRNQLNHQPQAVAVHFLAGVDAQAHTSLGDAVKEIGGIGVFLYLFAWVVEHSSREKEQAQALKLLFTLVSRNPHHAREFSDMGGYSMLAKVLGSDKCIIGYDLLKVLLDAMLTRSMLRYDSASQEWVLQKETTALIRDVHIVSQLLLAWRVWDRGPVHVWHTAFTALENLLRDDHPHQQFNARQLQNIGIIDTLLLICLERIQDSCPSLPVPICQSILNLTAGMLGHPPDVHIIMTICDFLLLIHPAASTYINHTPDEFYFIQKWAGRKSPRRLSGMFSGTKTLNAPSLTSTPMKRTPITSADSLSDDSQSYVPENHLSRSQSLPTVAESPLSGQDERRSLERSQTVSDCNAVDNARFLSPTVELDNLVPALIIDQNKDMASEVVKAAEPDDQPRESERSSSRKTSEKSEPVQFYVETGSERSSTSSASAVPDVSSVEARNRTNANNRQAVSTTQSNSHSGIDSHHQHGETSEDENGNSTVSGSYRVGRLAARELFHSTPSIDQLSSGALDCLVAEGDIDPEVWSHGKVNSPFSVVSDGDSPVEEEERGLVHISVGLLDLLCNILVLLPENDLSKILGVILKPETLLVMAHHQAPEIRKSIVRLLDMFFHRANLKQKEQFLRQQGFHLLASQLYQHAATQPLLEACFTVLFGRPHALEDDFEVAQFVEMSRVQKQAVIPILALLESTASNTPVAHFTLVLLMKLLEQVDCLMPVMLENALSEVLCNMLSAVHASPARLNDAGADERYVLIEDLQHFFGVIAERAFSTSGVAYYQHFEDSLALLHALEISEVARYGLESEEVGNIRNIRAHVLRTVFDYVIGRLDSSGSGQLIMSTKVGSLLSFLPTKRPTTEGSSANADSSSPPSGGSRSTSRRSAPANISRMHQSSSGSYHSDSPGSTLDWSHSIHSPSVTMKGFHGNKKMEIGQGELLERFKKLVVLASEFVMYSVPRRGKQTYVEQRLSRLVHNSIEVISFENDFARFLSDFLIRGIVVGMERSFFQRKTLHSTIMWQAKDVLRIQFSSLVAHLSSPTQPLGQRLFMIELLCNETKKQEVLKQVINIANLGQKLVFYLYELLVSHLEQLTKAYREEVDDLISTLGQLNLRVLRIGYKISANTRAMIDEDQKLWQLEGRREKLHWLKKHDAAKLRLLSRVDTFARRISGCAMELTQTVVNAQNAERRKLVEHVKAGMSQRLGVKKSWQQLIQQLSHERAVWHCPESYPTSWQLDPTEGPCRVRRRTQRCHLSMGKRYLDEGYQEKLDAETKTPPLSYLFDEDVMTSDSAALIYRLLTNEKIQHTCRCTSVTPSSETPGELLIGQNSVYFVGDEAIMDANYTQVLLGNKDLLSMTLPNEDVTEIHKRWYQLRDIGLEVFLTNGKTSLLAFENIKERDSVYRLLLSQELPNLIQNENLTAIQQMWLDRRMTNFEYLTHLNKMAGRSFNDLMQYPVFPFVLAKYDEKMLDLDAHSTYRNLAKPISVQHKDREEKYIENYRWLAMEKERLVELEPTLYAPDPYHYGSHYSNSGTVLHFLVRVPPFTQMFLVYQDKNFDLPDRTFHSLHTAWRLASEQSTTDVKELIPEFFYLPEFLTNTEGFAFGSRQDGVKVWDVLLPEWCGGDPRIFSLIHRQALESDYITQHLAAWIDLVFGSKQTGKAAIDAINVFHPATYVGTDVNSISDPVRRTAIKTMIKTYGQTPKQLFKMAHPTPQALKSGREKCPAMKSVTGLRWGNYVGSPDQPEPVMVWSQNHGSLISSLVALPTDDVFGLGLNSCLLVMYSKEKGVTAVNTTDVLWAAIISWNHSDGIVRVQNRRNAPAINLLHWGLKERVTCCAAVPDCRLLFFGSTSGVVTVFNTKFNADKVSNLQVFGRRQCLYGHSGAVTDMYVCKPYSVLVTTSTDSTAIIWDLNRLCYVRTITDHKASVQLVSVSDTSGDIATVSHAGRRSVLKLHTINATLVGSVRSSRAIHCLAFSNAPEGRAVNIIAGGLSNGTIRFWSTWDMAVVRDITWDKFTKPIASLTFTHNSQRLYAADVDGTVAVFEKPKSPTSRTKPVNFISFL